MDARFLLPGDVFVEIAPHDYAALDSPGQAKLKTVTVRHLIGDCTTAPGRVHLATSAGDWCVPGCTPVTLTAGRGQPSVAA